MDDLLTDFITETRETLEAIAGELVAWEADPADRSRLDAIFRFVHTVKGSCGFLDLPRLERLSHAAEDVLGQVRAGARAADSALVSAVLAVIDRIGELADAMESGEALPDGEDFLLVAALTKAPTEEKAAPVPVKQPLQRSVARSIRLPVELLDRLMAGVSDMVLARNELSRTLRDVGAPEADAAFERLSLCVGEIRDAITRTRMARIDALFSLLPRMTRDLSAQLGKSVQLEIDGGDVELDREMIEMIRDPLTHIVRNSIDHGIETPEARTAAGKPATGRLRIAARQSGNQILIEAIDDGRGMDGDKLVARALANGLITTDQAVGLSWARKLDLVFLPGFSTASAISEISGRGVGMDVVRANIERIGGTVDVESRPGLGLKLTMRVPLTLTIIPALIVGCGEHCFAVPRSAIDEIVRPNGAAVRLGQLGDALIAVVRDQTLPVVDLRRLLDCVRRDTEDYLWPVLVVVRASGGERFALSVDAVLDHEELVVKPAAPAIMSTGIYAGTTLPDNSRPILLLDVGGIASAAGISAAPAQPIDDTPAIVAEARVPTLLFRDLDGMERAIRLGLVERIEDVPAGAASETAGRLRIAIGDQILPLVARGAIDRDARLRILLLGDGAARIAHAIDRVIDIADLPEDLIPATRPGPIAGVMLVDGRQIELVDGHWLFADAARPGASAARPICLIADGEDPWVHRLLRPLLVGAGYEVTFAMADGACADVVIATGDRDPPASPAPVVRLRDRSEAMAGDTRIWRYDREGLLGALRAASAGRR